MAARANDEGWTLVDSSRQYLEYSTLTTSPRLEDLIFLLLLFSAIFSLDFIEAALQEIMQTHPGHSTTTQGAMAHENCGLALEMFIKHWRAGSGFKER